MKQIKYVIVLMLSVITKRTVINFFVATHVVSGNVVQRIR